MLKSPANKRALKHIHRIDIERCKETSRAIDAALLLNFRFTKSLLPDLMPRT